MARLTVDAIDVAAYTIPTDAPESDGTLEWDRTTIIVVHASGGGTTGLGYTYGSEAVATLVRTALAPVVERRDAMDVGGAWDAMGAALRNAGRPGIGMMAVAAIDIALWDLKARLLDVPLADLLPSHRDCVPVYGSGGFTSYSLDRLRDQLGGWVAQGIPRVKMKVSRRPEDDPARLDAARAAIGEHAELLVDANGALDRTDAVEWAYRFREEWNVCWFEEPVSSEDPDGLHFVRKHAPGGLDVAAGEYGFVLADFASLLEHAAVDCLQADVTRAGGISGLLQVGGLAAGHALDVSGHCAPNASAHALCALPRVRHLEYFHDHVRVESMLFDGGLEPADGSLAPDRGRPGLGLALKVDDAERYRVA